jgi:hypothetical protein
VHSSATGSGRHRLWSIAQGNVFTIGMTGKWVLFCSIDDMKYILERKRVFKSLGLAVILQAVLVLRLDGQVVGVLH